MADYLNRMPIYLQMLIWAGIAMILSIIIRSVLFGILKTTNQKVNSFTIQSFIKLMRGPVFWFIATVLLSIFWEARHQEHPENDVLLIATKMANTLLYVFTAMLFIRLTYVVSDTIQHRFNIDNENNLTERKILTQLQYIRKVVVIAIVVLAIAFILLQFDTVKSLGTGILTASGVTGIIVGLAAQKSIANLLAGFQIAFTQPIRIDDALIINGEFGKVEEITLTYVTLKLWDERRMIVPLQHFINNPFQNWTRSSSELLGTVMLYTDFTIPIEALRAELDRFLPTQELWDKRAKGLQVTDLSERAMTIRVLVSSTDSGSTFALRCAVREHLITFIQQNYPASLPRTRVELPPDNNGVAAVA